MKQSKKARIRLQNRIADWEKIEDRNKKAYKKPGSRKEKK